MKEKKVAIVDMKQFANKIGMPGAITTDIGGEESLNEVK